MATLNWFHAAKDNLLEVCHLGTDQLTVALCAAANAPVATNSVLADLTEISYTNLSSRNITTSSSSQTTGTYSLVLADLVLTASGGAVATFRYVVIYDNTPSSPADPLICWYDYGGNVTLADTETFTIDFGASLFTMTHA
jgi:hypothetical protein